MNLKIHNSDTPVREKNVYLKLVPSSTRAGGVSVVAVDENGGQVLSACLITFLSGGEVVIHHAVNRKLGFKLTDQGKITLDEE